jgi:hypothetical protein
MTSAQQRAFERLVRWHWDVAARLADDELLPTGLPIYSELPTDRSAGNALMEHLQKIAAAVTGANAAGKSGLVVFVGLGQCSGPTIGTCKLTFKTSLQIAVVEDTVYNAASTGFAPDGTGTHAEVVAGLIADSLKNWRDGAVMGQSLPQDISGDHAGWLPAAVREQLPADELNRLVWGVEVHSLFEIPIRARLPWGSPAPISHLAGNVTITGPSGATVKYTTDGRYPSAANSATTYSAPFAVAAPCVVRAVAKKSEYADSDLAELEIAA